MKRNIALDIARGLCIFLIVLSHAGYGYSSMFTFFYVQVFFYLGGVFMNLSQTIENSLYKKVRGLLYPYIFFGTICAILCLILGRVQLQDISLLDPDSFDNGPEWFLIALFTLTMIKFVINQIPKISLRISFVTIFFLLTYWAGFHQIDDTTNIVKAGISLPFLMLGTYHLQIESFIKKYRYLIFVFWIILWVISVFVLKAHIGIRWLELPENPIAYLCFSLVGIGLVVSIGYVLENVPWLNKLFGFWGIYSLFVLCIHWPIVRMVSSKFPEMNNYVIFSLCIIVCCVTAYIGKLLKKYVPMLR